MSQVFKVSKGGKEARLKEEGYGGGTKGVPLQTPGGLLQMQGVMRPSPGLSGREDGNSTLPETRGQIPDLNQN